MFFMDLARQAPNRVYRYARGFSLISLVMGLGIGLLAVELGVQWLGISHRQWNLTTRSLSADGNSRSLFLSLKQDLNTCGYRGLRQGDAHYPVENFVEEPEGRSMATAVRGMTVSDAALEFDAAWRSRLLPDSDVLEITDIPIDHAAVELQESDVLQLSDVRHIKKGQQGLIADAKGAAKLWVDAVDKAPGKRIRLHTKIHRIYGEEAIFTPVEQVIYFVARSERDPKERYALWRRVKGKKSKKLKESKESKELLQGIKAFKLQYNVLKSGVCQYKNYLLASEITDWSSVCRVRVAWTDMRQPQEFSAEIGVGYVAR